MPTTFAEIQTLTDDRLEHLYCTGPSSPSFNMQARIERLRSGEQQIRQALAQHDLTPLAVIPSTIWKQICDNTGLHRLAPDRCGQVAVSTKDARYFMIAGRVAAILVWLVPWIALAVAFGQLRQQPQVGLWFFSAMVCFFAYIGMLLFRADWRHDSKSAYIWMQRMMTVALSRVYDLLPRQRIINRLLRPVDAYSSRATLLMPTPPDDVVQILHRAERFYGSTMKVAIEPGGFSFQEKPSEIIRPDLDRYVRDVARSWSVWRSQHDPIFYVEDGDMAVILAQFGPFAIEREAVDQALAAEDII